MKWRWIQHMSSALKVGEFLFQNLGENTQNQEGIQNPCTQYVLNFYFIFYHIFNNRGCLLMEDYQMRERLIVTGKRTENGKNGLEVKNKI